MITSKIENRLKRSTLYRAFGLFSDVATCARTLTLNERTVIRWNEKCCTLTHAAGYSALGTSTQCTSMKKTIQNSLLLICSLGFSLAVAELTVSIASPQNLSGSWRVATASGLLLNKSSGRARHQFHDRVVNYRFASPHLRGPLLGGSVKVLVLGDSFTFGWLLDDKHNYVNRLQRMIDGEFGADTVALVNAAAGGWGTGDYVAYAEEFGEEVKPDLVLVFINTDDIGRALKSPLWTFDSTSGVLERKVVPVSKLKQFMNKAPGYQWLLEHSHLMQLARATLLSSRSARGLDGEGAESPKPKPVTTGPRSDLNVETDNSAKALGVALFSRLHSWCRSNDVDLIVTTTGWHQPSFTPSEPTKVFLTVAEELFSKLGVPFWDPSNSYGVEERTQKIRL